MLIVKLLIASVLCATWPVMGFAQSPSPPGDTLGALARMQEESAKAALAPPQPVLTPPAEMMAITAPVEMPIVIAIYGIQNDLVADVLVNNRLQTVRAGQSVLSGHMVNSISADGIDFLLGKHTTTVPVTRLLGGGP